MRAAHLPDQQLTAAVVPPPDAPLADLLRFGHRYHAYRVAGSLPRIATIAVEVHDTWVGQHDADPGAVLPLPLPRLRVALFHTARVLDQGAHTDDGRDLETWVRVLVRSVAAAVDADHTDDTTDGAVDATDTDGAGQRT